MHDVKPTSVLVPNTLRLGGGVVLFVAVCAASWQFLGKRSPDTPEAPTSRVALETDRKNPVVAFPPPPEYDESTDPYANEQGTSVEPAHNAREPVPEEVVRSPPVGHHQTATSALRKLSADQVLAMIRELPDERSYDTLLDLSGVDLRDADLQAADLRWVDFGGANLAGATLAHADLRSALLKDTNLSGANLAGADIRTAYVARTNLSGADLRNLNAGIVELENSAWGMLTFGRVDLRNADLRGADLRGTLHLGGVTLDGAVYDRESRFPPGFDPGAAGMTYIESS